MNTTARSIATTGGEPFPFNAMQRFTLPEDSTERVAITAAAMQAMVHHAAAIGPCVARVAYEIRNTFNAPARMLWAKLKNGQRHTPDPAGVELLRSPEQSAAALVEGRQFEGDCDDVAMLACAVAIRLGMACDLKIIRRRGNDWEHVYALVAPRTGGPFVAIDPQETNEPLAERAHDAALRFPMWRI